MIAGTVVAAALAALFGVLWQKEHRVRVAVEDRFQSVVDAETETQRVLAERDALEREIERLRAERDRDAEAEKERSLAEKGAVEHEIEHLRAEHNRRTVEDEALATQRGRVLVETLDATRRNAEAEIAEAKRHAELKMQKWQSEYSGAQEDLIRLQTELAVLTDDAEMRSFGLYTPLYDFAKSAQYKARLEDVRNQQRDMVRDETAAVCSTEWHVSGSKVEGRKMTARQLKLMLRAVNGECDSIVSAVTWKNVISLKERMERSFEAVNKLGETQTCAIQPRYRQLKIEELQLGFEHAEKLNAEREEQRALREQMREEEKAAKQIEKERIEAENEEAKYEKALAKAQAAVAAANVGLTEANNKERAALDEKIAKLEEMLASAHERKARAVSQAELTRTGNVYVLSNEGAFGPNVFKVGLTRRLDPVDRVDELGDASVPFAFDIHAIIRSDNAPTLEAKIHEALEPHRVNLVNRRKEFFRVPIEKIVDLVSAHHGHFEFTLSGEAVEYRKTLAIRAEREAMVAGRDAHKAAVLKVDEMQARLAALRNAAG